MVDQSKTDPIADGLRAWMAGDLNALEGVLDPQVTLSSVEPGPWDCSNRSQVMQLLRQRQAQQGNRLPPPVDIDRLDERTYIVTTKRHRDIDEPSIATRVVVAGNKVVAMQQFRAVG